MCSRRQDIRTGTMHRTVSAEAMARRRRAAPPSEISSGTTTVGDVGGEMRGSSHRRRRLAPGASGLAASLVLAALLPRAALSVAAAGRRQPGSAHDNGDVTLRGGAERMGEIRLHVTDIARSLKHGKENKKKGRDKKDRDRKKEEQEEEQTHEEDEVEGGAASSFLPPDRAQDYLEEREKEREKELDEFKEWDEAYDGECWGWKESFPKAPWYKKCWDGSWKYELNDGLMPGCEAWKYNWDDVWYDVCDWHAQSGGDEAGQGNIDSDGNDGENNESTVSTITTLAAAESTTPTKPTETTKAEATATTTALEEKTTTGDKGINDDDGGIKETDASNEKGNEANSATTTTIASATNDPAQGHNEGYESTEGNEAAENVAVTATTPAPAAESNGQQQVVDEGGATVTAAEKAKEEAEIEAEALEVFGLSPFRVRLTLSAAQTRKLRRGLAEEETRKDAASVVNVDLSELVAIVRSLISEEFRLLFQDGSLRDVWLYAVGEGTVVTDVLVMQSYLFTGEVSFATRKGGPELLLELNDQILDEAVVQALNNPVPQNGSGGGKSGTSLLQALGEAEDPALAGARGAEYVRVETKVKIAETDGGVVGEDGQAGLGNNVARSSSGETFASDNGHMRSIGILCAVIGIFTVVLVVSLFCLFRKGGVVLRCRRGRRNKDKDDEAWRGGVNAFDMDYAGAVAPPGDNKKASPAPPKTPSGSYVKRSYSPNTDCLSPEDSASTSSENDDPPQFGHAKQHGSSSGPPPPGRFSLQRVLGRATPQAATSPTGTSPGHTSEESDSPRQSPGSTRKRFFTAGTDEDGEEFSPSDSEGEADERALRPPDVESACDASLSMADVNFSYTDVCSEEASCSGRSYSLKGGNWDAGSLLGGGTAGGSIIGGSTVGGGGGSITTRDTRGTTSDDNGFSLACGGAYMVPDNVRYTAPGDDDMSCEGMSAIGVDESSLLVGTTLAQEDEERDEAEAETAATGQRWERIRSGMSAAAETTLLDDDAGAGDAEAAGFESEPSSLEISADGNNASRLLNSSASTQQTANGRNKAVRASGLGSSGELV